MRAYKRYLLRVFSYIECNSQLKKSLKSDLLSRLYDRSEMEGSTDPFTFMGPPKDLALEIIDTHNLTFASGYEYISNKTILGFPILHITNKSQVVAVGIIAVGVKSMGIFSLGIFSLGLLSIGVLSLGLLLSIGSIALSLLMSIGAVSLSYTMSLGAIAISNNLSLGAIAIGKVAIGVRAYGRLVFFSEFGQGATIININNQKELIEPALNAAYASEHIKSYIMRLLSLM